MTDLSKRKTMKTAGLVSAAVGTGLIGKVAFADAGAGPEVAALKLKIEQNDTTLRVALVNDSNEAVTLQNISPGRISTVSGDLELESLALEHGATIAPRSELSLPTRYVANKHNHSHLFLETSKNAISRELLVSTSAQPSLSTLSVLT